MAEFITQIVESLSYLGIAILMLIENVVPFIPSELIMPFAGFAASNGQLNFLLAALAGSIGSLAGAFIVYWVVRQIPEDSVNGFVKKHGRWVGLDLKTYKRAEHWFDAHAKTAVLLARLVPGIRTAISVPAGLRRMKASEYILFSAIGIAAWTTLLAYLGYLFGGNYEMIGRYISYIGYAIGAAVIGTIVWAVIRSRKKGHK